MKSYLDLIPASAKIKKSQTRMTRLCIILSVFLISGIFSMADIYIRSMKLQAVQTDGAWHAVFKNLDDKQMELVEARAEVVKSARYAAVNYRLDQDYEINGIPAVLCGFDEELTDLYPEIQIIEGRFPEGSEEAVILESMKNQMSLSIGDNFSLQTPQGSLNLTVCGIAKDTAMMLQSGAYGAFLNTEAYLERFENVTLREDFVLYVQFTEHCRIQNTIKDICRQLEIPQDQVGQNAKLLGLMLQSNDSYVLSLYLIAAILAFLVAFAGMLMIVGSLNSNISQRTEFFGMLRCLGATPKQIRHFVRTEALFWCRSALPVGLLLGAIVVWALCGLLKRISPTYFGTLPDFALSWIGLGAGTVIGLATVLAAARVPAKKASRVSPLAAVTGNADTVFPVKRAASTKWLHVETALGIHHATGSKKNLLLLASSFAFSIILFLSFSTGVDFMRHALTPLQPYTPDVSVVSSNNTCSISDSLFEELKEQSAVRRIFGRSFAYNLPVTISGENKTANLISYEEYQFGWAEGDLQTGDLEKVKNGEGILLVTNSDFFAEVGDVIGLQTEEGSWQITVAGVLGYSPFDREEAVGTMICSEKLFRQLTGENGYTIIDMQLSDQSDAAVEQLRQIAGGDITFSDRRQSNREVRGTYYAFALFIYGFLAIVTLIAVFNIINSIAMSVSARMRQYGAMRAIGIRIRQLVTMVVAETAAYVGCGVAIGLLLGFPLHYFLYYYMITEKWGDPWKIPVSEFGVIAAVMVLAAAAAVAGPIRRITNMSVVETIGTH